MHENPPSPNATTLFAKFALGVLLGAVLALGGWVFSVDRTLAATGPEQAAMSKQLDAIHTDIREMRKLLFELVKQGR